MGAGLRGVSTGFAARRSSTRGVARGFGSGFAAGRSGRFTPPSSRGAAGKSGHHAGAAHTGAADSPVRPSASSSWGTIWYTVPHDSVRTMSPSRATEAM